MVSIHVLQLLADVMAVESFGDALASRLCQEAVRRLPITGASVSMTTGGIPGPMVAATDDTATKIEELQFTLGEGPCVESSALSKPVLEPELARSGPARWPGFASAATEHGVGAIFAFPLQVGAIQLGVFDFYRTHPGDLGPADISCALAFSEAATLVLLHLQDAGDGDLHPQLSGAWATRAEVHQATGMLKVQLGVSITAAFLRLRAHAYATDRSILDVARDVVYRRLRLDEADL